MLLPILRPFIALAVVTASIYLLLAQRYSHSAVIAGLLVLSIPFFGFPES